MKEKSIKLNFIMNIILTMSSFIFPVITFPYVSRILLPEGTGKVAVWQQVADFLFLNVCSIRNTNIWNSSLCQGQR